MEKIPTEVTHWVGSVLLFIYKSKTENRFFFSVHSNFILLFTKVFVLFFFFSPPSIPFTSKSNHECTKLLQCPPVVCDKGLSVYGTPGVVSPVKWRRGWSRILRMRQHRSASGTRCCAGGCLSDCWRTQDCCCFRCCCPRCHWLALASCSPASPTAPGRAERNRRAWSGSAAARGLLTLMQKPRLQRQRPWPCYNAAERIEMNNLRLCWCLIKKSYLSVRYRP